MMLFIHHQQLEEIGTEKLILRAKHFLWPRNLRNKIYAFLALLNIHGRKWGRLGSVFY